MRLIITGVASTCTLPLPTRGAVCSSPTRSSALPVIPALSLPRSTNAMVAACGGIARPGRLKAAATTDRKPQPRKFGNNLYHRRMSPPRVVILGCGFGGLWAAQALRKAPVELTVVDRTNHHLFTPLLYQVATAGLAAPEISGPIRHILAGQRNVTVLMGEARSVDVARRAVVLEDGSELPYDKLIVATGSINNYFGNDRWAPFAPALKTLDDALEIRSRILLAFERAEREPDAARRLPWLTFVVIGAGATGVELAGTLAEIARHTLRGEFRHFDPRNARVVLVEGTDRVLPLYPPELGRASCRERV